MTPSAARRAPGGGSPGGRHRAAPARGAGRAHLVRQVLVALLVVGVVGLAGLTASRLAGSPSTGGTTAAEAASLSPTADPPPGPPAGGEPTRPATSGPSPSAAAGPTGASSGAVLPGDPIPGPAAPLGPGDGVTPAVLRVPTIQVDVPLLQLGILPDGAIEVPADAGEAGWLTASAVPGRTGPAVVAGHVDSATGVAVFTRLGELAPGDPVEVDLSDGTTVRYVVTGSERYPKDAFPSAEVYGPAPASVLRLITCGGRFDRAEGSYEDNLVVYAVPAT